MYCVAACTVRVQESRYEMVTKILDSVPGVLSLGSFIVVRPQGDLIYRSSREHYVRQRSPESYVVDIFYIIQRVYFPPTTDFSCKIRMLFRSGQNRCFAVFSRYHNLI